MIYFRFRIILAPDNGDDVKANLTVNVLILDVMVDGSFQVLEFPVVNRILWFAEHTIASCLYFDKNHRTITIGGNDVNVAVS